MSVRLPVKVFFIDCQITCINGNVILQHTLEYPAYNEKKTVIGTIHDDRGLVKLSYSERHMMEHRF